VDITDEAVEKVADSSQVVSSGLEGTDSHALKHWLPIFGAASQNLHAALADVTGSLMASRLGLDTEHCC
jgi:hypothetical protein